MFSRLDLDQAYQQLCVDEDTAMLQTVTTHKGLFKVTRLQFGVAVAVAIFKRYMEGLSNGLEELARVSDTSPISSPPSSPAPGPDGPDVPGSPSQEHSSSSQPPTAEASRYPRRERKASQRYRDYIP